jgi:hypothetical protein
MLSADHISFLFQISCKVGFIAFSLLSDLTFRLVFVPIFIGYQLQMKQEHADIRMLAAINISVTVQGI